MRLSLAAFIERIRSLRAQSPSGTDRLIREVTDQGYRIRLDVAGQVLRISVPERLVFRSPAEGEPLQPTPGHWSGFRRLDTADRAPQFVAAAMLVQKAK